MSFARIMIAVAAAAATLASRYVRPHVPAPAARTIVRPRARTVSTARVDVVSTAAPSSITQAAGPTRVAVCAVTAAAHTL